jgi:serine/threonine-protein kinase RIO1
MSQEILEMSFESLGLTKPLDKMTAKELRQLVVAKKIPSIVGASGMQKEELVTAIKGVFGIKDEEGAVSPYKDQIFTLKKTIRTMRVEKVAVESRKDRSQLRRKINKLKKRTRRLSRAL